MIETAKFEEDVSSDEPATGPKCLGLTGILVKIAGLMDVMVEEVAELADETRIGRRVVIRSKECVNLRTLVDVGEGVGDGVVLDGYVGVEEEDPLAASFVASEVSGRCRSTAFWQ